MTALKFAEAGAKCIYLIDVADADGEKTAESIREICDCKYIVALFDKDEPICRWLKENKTSDVWLVVFENRIEICIIRLNGKGEWKEKGMGYTPLGSYSFEKNA